MPEWSIRVIESAADMPAVEEIQRLTWTGSETDIIPGHMILAVVHNGGLALGAYGLDEPRGEEILIGLVFGFAGLDLNSDGLRYKHHSHILAVHPAWREKGIAFALKRAQWQMVRHQGIERITWTYDPLLSRNANLNIARLGSVCNTYLRSEYGDMRDDMNAGLPSDRFQVDWWARSKRVERRLGNDARPKVTADQLIAAGAQMVDATGTRERPHPPDWRFSECSPVVGVEIPGDFPVLKSAAPDLAIGWRIFSRAFFEDAFTSGYVVTDFVFGGGRCYYVLTQGESTL